MLLYLAYYNLTSYLLNEPPATFTPCEISREKWVLLSLIEVKRSLMSFLLHCLARAVLLTCGESGLSLFYRFFGATKVPAMPTDHLTLWPVTVVNGLWWE